MSRSTGSGRERLRHALRLELALAFRAPYATLLVLAGNAALVTAAWFGLPTGLQDWLFRYHGALVFPMVLASWMLADVPATNVLASDPARATEALDDRGALLRLLYAKSLVLWLLVGPLCAVVALVVGATSGRWVACALTAVWVLVVPAGTLGFSSCLGVVAPYHPRALAWRWENRHAFRRVIARWLALVLVPYVLVPLIGAFILALPLLFWIAVASPARDAPIPNDQIALIVAASSVIAVVAFVAGHRTAARLARGRCDALRSYLRDPDRG
jgi:hypothetical protein